MSIVKTDDHGKLNVIASILPGSTLHTTSAGSGSHSPFPDLYVQVAYSTFIVNSPLSH